MKVNEHRYILILLLIYILSYVGCTELTFELEDNAKQCFHEVLKKDVKSSLEFQVVTGGHYDVDVILKDPKGKILYDEKKKQYDSHSFTTTQDGEYVFCFSNEFSTFTHKVIYFDFQSGDEPPMAPGMGTHHTALTQLETSALTIHESLKVIIDYQTHHRLREATGRDTAEYINERVQYWSIGQTVIILTVSIAQVFILRNFFAEKRDRV